MIPEPMTQNRVSTLTTEWVFPNYAVIFKDLHIPWLVIVNSECHPAQLMASQNITKVVTDYETMESQSSSPQCCKINWSKMLAPIWQNKNLNKASFP
jgi:hypothetical protein